MRRAPGDMSLAGHVSAGDTATLQPVVLSGTAAAESLSLVVFAAGGAAPAALRLDGPLSVGRAAHCSVVLADAGASREHARLLPAPGGVEVTDLGSRNGTFVDGRRVTRSLAAPGSLIRIGDSFL